jgi:hypothetical protein
VARFVVRDAKMKKLTNKEEIKELQAKFTQVQELIDSLAQLETTAEGMEDGEEKDVLKTLIEKVKTDVLVPIWQSVIKLGEACGKLIEARDRLIECYPPDTFWGDLLRVEQYRDIEAAKRLAAKWFQRNAIFFPDRWHKIEPYFRGRLEEDTEEDRNEGEGTAWENLVISALFLALDNAEGGDLALVGHPKTVRGEHKKLKFGDLRRKGNYRWLRNEIRIEIERDLLAGCTSDSNEFQAVVLNYTEDTPEAEKLDAEAQKELITYSSNRIDTLLSLSSEPGENIDATFALSQLNENEKIVLLGREIGYTDDELALRYGITLAAIRKRRERIRNKITQFSE